MRRSLVLSLLAVAGASATGCLEPVTLDLDDIGVLRAEAVDGGGGVPALRITGIFYRGANVGIGVGAPETCVDLPFSEVEDDSEITTLDAGLNLTATVPGATQEVPRRLTIGRVSYSNEGQSPLDYTPGDTLRIDIPGTTTGFPATDIAVRTAEVLELDPIVLPATAVNTPITWAPVPAPGAVVTALLRYAAANSVAVNRQVYCVYTDDGASTVPGSLIAPFLQSDEATRSIVVSRVRFTTNVLDRRTRVVAYSSYSVPLPSILE